MSTSAHDAPESLTAFEPTLLPDGPFIVATDTGPESDAAFPLAAALAARTRAEIMALTVVEPTNIPIYGVDGMVVSMESAEDTQLARESATHAQLTRMVSSTAKWPVVVKTGEPAREIAAAADALHARMVVVGRGRHSGIDRIFGGESVLRMLQLGDSPVLAVEETLTSPPRRVVIATDFSAFSMYAAQVAMTVVAPDATVWLLHVGPPFDETVPFLKDRAETYRAQAETAFTQMRALIQRSKVQIESVVLTGSAPDQLLKFVADRNADLVVTATHGYGFIRRMILGSVAATLIRHAPCSVLVVPGSARTIAAARARGVPNARTRTFAQASLDAELAAFTTRNIGRRCLVEVDRDDLGAQVLGHDLQLAGATFDRRDTSASLMFGTSTLKGLHLTHHIAGVTEIDLATNAGGEDQVLRIAQDGGQTLVTLS
ncbi:MAG: universal stress protein [Gemmatimonadaceae bacterium]|nr:universal stress protein [Gemmatimonadaceae bacterium]